LPYYEVIYEDGSHSIAQYDDDDEALSAINAHVERAKQGIPGTAANSTPRVDLDIATLPVEQQRWPAQRVAKVYVYDEHPADYADHASTLSADVAKKTVADLVAKLQDSNGVVGVADLANALMATMQPRKPEEELASAHDSTYKMKESRELALEGGVE
jgi:hypothetical protein